MKLKITLILESDNEEIEELLKEAAECHTDILWEDLPGLLRYASIDSVEEVILP